MRSQIQGRLLGVALIAGCTGGQVPKAEPGKADPVKAEVAKVEPAKAEPAKVEPVKAEVAKVEPAKAEPAGACDPGGTWRVEMFPAGDGCPESQEEKFELALGFVRGDAGVTLASAAKGAGGALAGALAAVRGDLVVGPGAEECGVRVRVGAADAEPRAELLLKLQGAQLVGAGSLWRKVGGKRCYQPYSVVADRGDAAAGWAKLGASAPAPVVAPPVPAGEALAKGVRGLAADALLGGVRAAKARVKLKGSIVDYVAAIVEGPKSVRLVELACTDAAGARCVAVVGDPCAGAGAGEDCEGMFLTVVVDPRTGKLDRADAGGYPVASQADVEARLEMAP